MKIQIVITHASFDEDRRMSLHRLVGQLRLEAPKIPFLIAGDHEKRGSLWCWKKALGMAFQERPDYIVWLPDDAIVCRDFGAIIEAAITARPDDVFDCIMTHKDGVSAETLWYSTSDGFLGHGGTMPTTLWMEHLAWRQRANLPDEYPNDAGVNLWAMATGRLIYKPTFSMVQHDLTVGSLDGHDKQPKELREGQRFLDGLRKNLWEDLPNFLARTFLTNETDYPGIRTSCTHLGRTYEANHLALVELLTPQPVERYFDVARGHGIVPSETPSLFIAAPAYRGEVKSDWVVSVIAEMEILRKAKVDVTLCFKADSLINRARNRLVTDFLLSDASHMLMWDTDNFPTEPGAVKTLLETGHEMVGGAVVLKDGKGNKFAMRFGGEGHLKLKVSNGCIPVDMIGTAFLMVSRKAILKMIRAYPETYYRAGRWMENPGRAEWHLFADKVRDRDHLSEDFEFCKRWKDIGEELYIQPDIDFVHYGEFPFTGSFSQTFFKESEA